uniref:NADH-ubiquinone oxidoreductase chain 5 n=1 Tax=Palpitomonas bilix TaxID=652834 RepID=A0A1E1GHN0_9EUKA|nr:NADH dehydrogenase subunit 5 [Palpitomonas bilix]YP_009317273.1 NADH dehydrogenase subunit 5 [Palpitomonas bilix]BAV82380.1 NADH dehydrogenase subunit 5 [Palpitomonas bilix]BAV82441.1 NADH dehydrogenase subunit 5 [Palpitomonas bilix]
MYLLIVALPLISALTSGLFGRFLGSKGAGFISVCCLIATSFLSFIAFYEVALNGSPCYIKLATWVDSEMLHADWGFVFDSLTVIMLVVVTFVSALVHLYSTGYMEGDPHVPRFMSYLSLFTFFMVMLVTADNFIQMFLGWEGVGLCSYLLITFWFTRVQANKAALKAFIVNRVGDFGLSLGVFAIFYLFSSLDFSTVFALAPYMVGSQLIFCGFEVDSLTLICILLFVGAVGKSAQLGLHTWLPDAMEGPTPVSALIHAATMVTAGVFMIARCSPLFEFAPTALFVVAIVGAMTAFFAATTGMLQNDLKKVIAYSTCSQLGYMVFVCGLSNYSVGVFHLANHAFFKALLFLSAGSVIHAMSDEQDMRRMGGLAQIIPFTYVMMVIGSLSLMGFPFLTGFYSKDVILEIAYAKYSFAGTFSHWLGCISAFFTAFYSFRLLYLTFIQNTNAYKRVIEHAHESSFVMLLPLILLSFGSIFVGYLTKDMIIGLGTSFWGNSIFTLPTNITMVDAEFLPYYIKLIPVILSLSGAVISLLVYHFMSQILFNVQTSFIGRHLYIFFNKKWFFDKIYNYFFVQHVLRFGYSITFKSLDKGLIEFLGPYGIANVVSRVSSLTSALHTGYIYHYAFVMFVGVVFILRIIF